MDLVCFKETKLKDITCGIIRSLAVGRFVDWVASNVEGASRGILILWNSRVLQLVEAEESCYSLSCKFQNIEDNITTSCGFFRGFMVPEEEVYSALCVEWRQCSWDGWLYSSFLAVLLDNGEGESVEDVLGFL